MIITNRKMNSKHKIIPHSTISVIINGESLGIKIPVEIAKTIKALVDESKKTDTFFCDLIFTFPLEIVTSKIAWQTYCNWKKTNDAKCIEELEKDNFLIFLNIITNLESMHTQQIKIFAKKYIDICFESNFPKKESQAKPIIEPKKELSEMDIKWKKFHDDFKNPLRTRSLETLMKKTSEDWISKKCSHEKKYNLIHELIDNYVLEHSEPEYDYDNTIWKFFNQGDFRSETNCLIAITYAFFGNSIPQMQNPTETLIKSYKTFFSTSPTFAKEIWTLYNKFFFDCLIIKSDGSCRTIEKQNSYEDAIKYIFKVNSINPLPWKVVKTNIDQKEAELIRICNEVITHQNKCGYIGQSEELVKAKNDLRIYRNQKKKY